MSRTFILPLKPNQDGYTYLLNLEAMPADLTPGAYARVVLASMAKSRAHTTYYGSNESVTPMVQWSKIVNSAQDYGLLNGWLDDGYENVMKALLQGGADCSGQANFWSADITEWTFTNRNLLAVWCHKVGTKLFFKKIESSQLRSSSSSVSGSRYIHDNLALCGMWLMSQKDVLGDLPKIWSDVYRYVEFIRSMEESTFLAKVNSQSGSEVVYPNTKYTALYCSVETAPQGYAWESTAFKPLALGMAWQLSQERQDITFERVSKLLDLPLRIMPDSILQKMYAQTENIQHKMVVLSQEMDKDYKGVDPSNWFEKSPNTRWGIIEPAYGTPGHLKIRPAVVSSLMTLMADAKYTLLRQALWVGVKSASSASYFNTAHADKLAQWTPVFQSLDLDARTQLINDLVHAISFIQVTNDNMTPWERWANFMEDHSGPLEEEDLSWAVQVGQWFVQWLPEYTKDIGIILTVTDDVSTFGQLFTDTLRRGNFTMDSFDASSNLDGLFD